MIRVHIHAPKNYIEAVRRAHGSLGQQAFVSSIRTWIDRSGLGPALVVTHDPTDVERVTVLTHAQPHTPRVVGPFRLLRIDEVVPDDTPPIDMTEARSWHDHLDPGLTLDEAWAVGRALEIEDNPRHLIGFAVTCEPWFPVAASRLRMKGALVSPTERASRMVVSGKGAFVDRTRIGACAARCRLPIDVLENEIRRTVCTYVAEPLFKLGASLPNVTLPDEVRSAAAYVIDEDVKNRIRLVDRARLLSICSAGHGTATPAALQLALAAGKPEISAVRRREQIEDLFRGLDRPGVPPEERMKAKLALEKAHRGLERGRWVRWYRRSDR